MFSDNYSYLINESNITLFLQNPTYKYKPNVIVNLENITKVVTIDEWYKTFEVTFNNLDPGIHIMTFHCLEDNFSEPFLYNITFEINNHAINITENNAQYSFIDNDSSDDVGDNGDLGTDDGEGYSYTNNSGSINLENSTEEVIPNKNQECHINIKNSDFNSQKHERSEFEDNLEISSESESEGGKVNEDQCIKKSYEILKKSVSKSIDNILSKLGFLGIVLILFMVGYFRNKNE